MAADPLLEDYNRHISNHSLSAYAPPTLDEDALFEQVEKMSGASQTEAKMFNLQQLPYKPNSPIIQMVAASNRVVFLLSGQVAYTNLDSPQDYEVFRFDKQPYKIHLDPTGKHLLIVVDQQPLSYICLDWPAPRSPVKVQKIKGLLIETVAWDPAASSTSTGEMLVATSNVNSEGKIENKLFQCFLDNRDGRVDCRWKHVFALSSLPSDMFEERITGIHYERFPSDPTKVFLLITSTFRILRFVGRAAQVSDVFSHYTIEQPRVNEMLSNIPLKHSRLCVANSETGRGNFVSWLCPVGIFSATITLGNQIVGDDVLGDDQTIFSNEELEATSAASRGDPPPQGDVEPPTDIYLTSFHWLVLWHGKLQVVSKLDKQNVSDVYIPNFPAHTGKALSIVYDKGANTIWLPCEQAVFKVIVDREDRHLWKQFLRRAVDADSTLDHNEKIQYFAEADRYATEQFQRDEIALARGEFYFASGNYELAAQFFGKTNRSFEDIVLKFQRVEQDEALRRYLLFKLSNTPQRMMSQRTLLSTWLVQVFLDKLTSLRGDPRNEAVYRNTQKEFHAFLQDYRLDLNVKTVLDLLSSHGQVDELLFFATLVGDYLRVINFHLQQPQTPVPYGTPPEKAWRISRDRPIKAIKLLRELPDNVDLVQRFAPTLVQLVPHKTVRLWIACVSLEPRRLIPAMMRYTVACNSPKPKYAHVNMAIYYLNFCVVTRHNKEPAIHNFLLALLAKEPIEEPLLKFLEDKRRAMEDGEETFYDENYALRICLQQNKIRACVLIYEMKKLYEEAVELALRVDVDLAKQVASRPQDVELQKKLFIMVARHMLGVSGDPNKINKAVDLLSYCKHLKIEDILPYFEDFDRLHKFKGLLNSSLDHYDKDIKQLLDQMTKETMNANLLRDAIQQTRSRYGYVAEPQACDLCNTAVLTREFYVFPCQHVFHAHCLEQEAANHLDVIQKTRFRQTKQLLAPLEDKMDQEGQLNELEKSHYELLLDELEDLIANDCLFCGNAMIESLDRPFISGHDAAELRAWQL